VNSKNLLAKKPKKDGKEPIPERIHETKTKIDLRIVISQLLSLSTQPNFLFKEKTLQKKSLIQILVESFGKILFLEEKTLKRSHFSCSEFSAR
jgi:hypothetical protein